MGIQLKRDPWVIVPYTLFTGGALVALVFGKITMPVFLSLIGALNVASAFGLKSKGKDDDDDPPTGTSGEPYRTFSTMPPAMPPTSPRERVVCAGAGGGGGGGAARTLLVVTAFAAGGCASRLPPPTETQKHDAADTDYAKDHLACVKAAKTLEESHACRAETRAAWDAGAREGGK